MMAAAALSFIMSSNINNLFCNHNPCRALLHHAILEGELTFLSDSNDHSEKWYHLYRCFVHSEHDSLDHHNHVHIMECVVSFICTICPNPVGTYTCHQSHDGHDENWWSCIHYPIIIILIKFCSLQFSLLNLCPYNMGLYHNLSSWPFVPFVLISLEWLQ